MAAATLSAGACLSSRQRCQARLTIRQPTYLADLALRRSARLSRATAALPDRAGVEQALIENALNPFLDEIAHQRAKEVETIARHLEISLGELIHRANMSLAELVNRRIEGENVPGLEGNIAQAEAHLDELNNRLEGRRAELAQWNGISPLATSSTLAVHGCCPPRAKLARHRTHGS